MNDKTISRKASLSLSTPLRLGAAAVAACFFGGPLLANPVSPTVVNGAASFSQTGNVLTVTNSNGAIINWDKFSIQAGETTRFIQASASSSVLNRVLNDPTAIYGTLSSNGRVWLVNPAGIMVGAGGRVDVAGFVASTLNISNENFLAGRRLFDATPGAGDVVNQGVITTPSGGSVYLIGANVGNEGIITTPQGETILAAGQTVSLIDSATPGVKVNITGTAGNATNLGQITAEAGRIGIAGVIVKNSGLINASSVVADGGRIFLKATGDTLVDGGQIRATSAIGKGGQVEVLGDRVAVYGQAEIDVSGATGGGSILIGGDYQGRNPDIRNAAISYFGVDALLKADATDQGDGGRVIVWADGTTRAYGSIFARGGANGGNGGFVETSGHSYLEVTRAANVGAARGSGGTWLIDPTDITIIHSGTPAEVNISASSPFVAPSGNASQLSDYTINQGLLTGNVTIDTASSGSAPGDIIFDSSSAAIVISNPATAARTLDLVASHDIVFSGANGTTFKSPPSTSSLDVGFHPAGVVTTLSGSAVILDGTSGSGPARIWLDAGRTWKNFGHLTLVDSAAVYLGVAATFHNQSTGLLDSGGTTGWAFWSSANDDGIIANDGVINITKATAFEAAFNQSAGGSLNLIDNGASVHLNLQNAQSISGTIDLMAGTFAASLNVNEYHGSTAQFNNVNFSGAGGTVYVGGTVGGSSRANFSNVTAPNTALNIGTPNSGLVGFTGDAVFALVTINGGTLTTLNNARLGIAQGGFTIPSGVSYVGNVGYLANGYLALPAASSIATTGNLTLVAGWDGTTPFSSITGTTDATGLAGVAANLDFSGSSSVSAGGGLTLKAANNIRLLGDAAGGVQIASVGAQGVYAKAQLNVIGSSAASNGSAWLSSESSQTITANSIDVKAGDGAGIHDSSAQIVAWGSQQINVGTTAAGWINVWSGTATQDSGSYNNQASITHGQWGGGSFSGNQSITLGNGSPLDIRAGKGSSLLGYTDNECATGCAGANNSAYLSNYYGNMTIATPAGGSITITGGSVGSNNWAGIESQTAGTMTVGSLGTAPSIVLNGGASGGSLGVKLPAYGGGINYNSNDATLSSDGTLTVYASSVALNAPGGAGTYAAAYLGAPVVTINTTGNLSLTGGGGNSALPTTLSTPVAIGSEHNTVVTLNVGGNLDMTGGTGNGAMALIGSLFGAADVTVNGQGSVSMLGGAIGVDRIGSLNYLGGQVTLISHGNMALGTGLVQTGSGVSDMVTLVTNNNAFSQASGGAINARTVSLATGTGSVAQAAGAIINAQTLTASGKNLSFLGDNQAANVILTSTGASGGISYSTASGVHVLSATAATGDISVAANVGSGAIIGLGTVTAASGNVSVTADTSILDDNGTNVVNVTGNNVALLSRYGGNSGALAISADTVASAAISAQVNASATYGGIYVRNFTASAPASMSFVDQAANQPSISLYQDSALSLVGKTFDAGSGGIVIGSSGTMTGISTASFTGAPAQLTLITDQDMSLSGALSLPLTHIGLGALSGTLTVGQPLTAHHLALSASTLNVGAPVTATGDLAIGAGVANIDAPVGAQDIILGANTLYVGPGGALTASNQNTLHVLATVTGNVDIDGGYIKTTGGDLQMIVGGNLTLVNGGHIYAGYGQVSAPFADASIAVGGNLSLSNGAYIGAANDIYLDMLGVNSTISLGSGSYVMSDIGTGVAATTYVAFAARNSGGIFIDGIETTKTVVGGSGFFAVNSSTPASEGAGLKVDHAAQSDGSVAQQLADIITRAANNASTTETPTDSDTPNVETPKGSELAAAGGRDEGGFGEDRDDKDKPRQDAGKDGKKEEKPAQKKVAQCS